MGNICKSQGPKKIVLGSYNFYGKADSIIMGDRIELPPSNKYPEIFHYQENWTLKDTNREIQIKIAHATQKGRGHTNIPVNQDAIGVTYLDLYNSMLIGVYDGHGSKGAQVSRFVADQHPIVLTQEEGDSAAAKLENSSKHLQNRVIKENIDVMYNGCRYAAIYIDVDEIIINICGDCQCLYTEKNNSKLKIKLIPKLHTISQDMSKIKKINAKAKNNDIISNEKLFEKVQSPSSNSTATKSKPLNTLISTSSKKYYQCHFAGSQLEYAYPFSHSIGDVRAHETGGITDESNVYIIPLEKDGLVNNSSFKQRSSNSLNPPSKVFIMATDALWERMTYDEVVNFINLYDDNIQKAATDLLAKCNDTHKYQRLMKDDVTILIIKVDVVFKVTSPDDNFELKV